VGLHRSERVGLSLRSDYCYWLAIGGAVLLGAALRAHHLAYESLWTDEIFSLITTNPGLPDREFWDRVLADTHPPLYYMILRLWSAAFGQSEAAVRLPSVFFGILTLVAAAVPTGLVLSRPSRLALTLLYAVSPGAIGYAQEARSYSLLLLLAVVLTNACIGFIQPAKAGNRALRRAMTILTLAALLASFTHYFGFLFSLVAFATCFAFTWRDKTRAALAAIGGLIVVGCFTPWLAYHMRFIDAERVAWIQQFPFTDSASWFEDIAFGGTPALAAFVIGLCMLIAKLRWRRIANFSVISVSVVLCALTVVASFVVSIHTPVLTGRNLIVLLPAIYLIAAELLSALASAWGPLVGVTWLGVQLALVARPSLVHLGNHTKEQWRESAAFVLNQSGCATATIHVYGEEQYYRFYTRKVRPQLRLREIPEGGTADLGHAQVSSCPILLWIVGVPEWELDGLLARVGLSRSTIEIVEYYEAYVVLARRS
jgi:uncharacterized membrane protein